MSSYIAVMIFVCIGWWGLFIYLIIYVSCVRSFLYNSKQPLQFGDFLIKMELVMFSFEALLYYVIGYLTAPVPLAVEFGRLDHDIL